MSWSILNVYLLLEYMKHYMFLRVRNFQISVLRDVTSPSLYYTILILPFFLFLFPLSSSPIVPDLINFLFILPRYLFHKCTNICLLPYTHFRTWKIKWYRYLETTPCHFIESFLILCDTPTPLCLLATVYSTNLPCKGM